MRGNKFDIKDFKRMDKFKDGKASFKDWLDDLTNTLGALDPKVSRATVKMVDEDSRIKRNKKKSPDGKFGAGVMSFESGQTGGVEYIESVRSRLMRNSEM